MIPLWNLTAEKVRIKLDLKSENGHSETKYYWYFQTLLEVYFLNSEEYLESWDVTMADLSETITKAEKYWCI